MCEDSQKETVEHDDDDDDEALINDQSIIIIDSLFGLLLAGPGSLGP